jgi:hypothetical protein
MAYINGEDARRWLARHDHAHGAPLTEDCDNWCHHQASPRPSGETPARPVKRGGPYDHLSGETPSPPVPVGDSSTMTWERVALLVGEELASVGPAAYYSMSPADWLTWALAALRSPSPEPPAPPVPVGDRDRLLLALRHNAIEVEWRGERFMGVRWTDIDAALRPPSPPPMTPTPTPQEVQRLIDGRVARMRRTVAECAEDMADARSKGYEGADEPCESCAECVKDIAIYTNAADALSALQADVERLTKERDENEGIINVWRRRCLEAEQERDEAAEILTPGRIYQGRTGEEIPTTLKERALNVVEALDVESTLVRRSIREQAKRAAFAEAAQMAEAAAVSYQRSYGPCGWDTEESKALDAFAAELLAKATHPINTEEPSNE